MGDAERQLLADNVPACKEFFEKYFDDKGYLQCFIRWGADDGADDALRISTLAELHALGAGDEIMRMYLKGHEGLIKQYRGDQTVEPGRARGNVYRNSASAGLDAHGEGLQLFNRMGCRSRRIRNIRNARGDSPVFTWARIPKPEL